MRTDTEFNHECNAYCKEGEHSVVIYTVDNHIDPVTPEYIRRELETNHYISVLDVSLAREAPPIQKEDYFDSASGIPATLVSGKTTPWLLRYRDLPINVNG